MWRIAVWLAATLCAGVCAADPPHLADGREAFDIALPADCTMTRKGPRIDFEVFYITCHGVDYAGVYAGNFADTSVPRSRLLKAPYGWPSQIQVWSDIVPNDQARADAIAASVRLKAPR